MDELVKQPAHPTIGHRSRHDTARLSSFPHLVRHLAPALIVTGQPVGRLDQGGPKLAIGRFDQSRVGLPLTAGSVTRTQPAEAGKLFARGEPVEAADFRPDDPCRRRSDPWKGPQSRYQGIIVGKLG